MNTFRRTAVVVFVVLLSQILAGANAQTRDVVDFIEVEGIIDPVVAAYIVRELDRAETAGSHAVVVRLNSSISVNADIEKIVSRIIAARVPVIVWIAPSGAEAASGATAIAASANVLAAAPGAMIGPAGSGFEEVFAAAAKARGRTAANRLLRDSFAASEAEQRGIADFVAGAPTLYQKLHGREVTTSSGPVMLETERAQILFHKMGLVERLLHGALRPDVAIFLIVLGLFGLTFELYHPGIGAAGVLGAMFVGLGLYAFTVLPVSWAAVALVFAGLAAQWRDLKVSRFGIASISGVAGVMAGAYLLFASAPEELRIRWWTIVGLGLACTLFFVGIMTAAIRARLSKAPPTSEVAVGTLALASTDIAPNGEVVAAGKTWRARTVGAAIAEGAEVRVKAVAGLVLMVEDASRPVNAE